MSNDNNDNDYNLDNDNRPPTSQTPIAVHPRAITTRTTMPTQKHRQPLQRRIKITRTRRTDTDTQQQHKGTFRYPDIMGCSEASAGVELEGSTVCDKVGWPAPAHSAVSPRGPASPVVKIRRSCLGTSEFGHLSWVRSRLCFTFPGH